MALKDTIQRMNSLLAQLSHDLAKAEKMNKAASQRVRTGSIHLSKVAKMYRKESIAFEKAGFITKKRPGKKVIKKKVAKKGKRK